MALASLAQAQSGWAAKLRSLRREPQLLAALVVVVALFAVFVLYPVGRLLFVPALEDWNTAIHGKIFLEAFWHTLASAFLAAMTAMLIGFLYACAMQYAQLPGRRFFQMVALLPFMAPSAVSGLAFLLLFGRRAELGGWAALWAVQTIAFFPLAYLTISGVLRAIGPTLERAAQNLGARGFYLFRTVTLRLAAPGLVSAFLFVGLHALADFGNPLLVGANYRVLTTEAYAQVVGAGNFPMGAVLAIVLAIPGLAVFFLQRSYLEKFSYGTMAETAGDNLLRVTVNPALKWLLFMFCCAVSAVLLLFIGAVCVFAFIRVSDGGYAFTLAAFSEGVVQSPALRNSWLTSMATAVITTFSGIALAVLTLRQRFFGRRLLDFLAMLPGSLPGIFIGLALVAAFSAGPLELTGTLAIVVAGLTLRQLPMGYRQAVAALSRIEPATEQASANLGADSFTTFCKVVAPILKKALSSTFFCSFLHSMNAISTVVFLAVPAWDLASIDIVRSASHGFLTTASALAVGMMLTVCATFGLLKLTLREPIHLFDF